MDWTYCIPRSSTGYSSRSIMDYEYKLESESDLESIAESVDSGQMELTASCQDTPDTESSLESEFSVESMNSSSMSIPEISSGPEDDTPFSVLKSKRTTKCLKCHLNKKNSSLLFCDRCFKERRRFLPPRPNRKRKRIGQIKHAIKVGESSQSTASQSDVDLMSAPLCGCCFERPSNGVFIHGEIGHQIFCYNCAQRVWLERKSCPYCNRLITKVVKLFKVDNA